YHDLYRKSTCPSSENGQCCWGIPPVQLQARAKRLFLREPRFVGTLSRRLPDNKKTVFCWQLRSNRGLCMGRNEARRKAYLSRTGCLPKGRADGPSKGVLHLSQTPARPPRYKRSCPYGHS